MHTYVYMYVSANHSHQVDRINRQYLSAWPESVSVVLRPNLPTIISSTILFSLRCLVLRKPDSSRNPSDEINLQGYSTLLCLCR